MALYSSPAGEPPGRHMSCSQAAKSEWERPILVAKKVRGKAQVDPEKTTVTTGSLGNPPGSTSTQSSKSSCPPTHGGSASSGGIWESPSADGGGGPPPFQRWLLTSTCSASMRRRFWMVPSKSLGRGSSTPSWRWRRAWRGPPSCARLGQIQLGSCGSSRPTWRA